MGKLIFTFTSLAYEVNARWGRGIPVEGFHRTAAVAHRHGLPVTWLVNAGSARALKDDLDRFHAGFGDDIGLTWGSSTAMPGSKGSPEEELAALRAMFPWSTVEVAGSGGRSNEMCARLAALGVTGLWGSCWEQIEVDDVTDRGCPWGTYYIAPDSYKLPAREPAPLVSFEWTARDLCKSLHSGNPTIWSSDPDDVARAGVCTGDDIAYWRALFDNYYQNLAHNDLVFFAQHQEAHEMEHSEVCHAYSPADIAASELMLDAFFAHVKSKSDVECVTLAQAGARYRRQNPGGTAPAYMLCDDALTRPGAYWYCRDTPVGPWPRTFLYYDADCQLAFIEGKFEPILLRDYVHRRDPQDPYYFAERDIPVVRTPMSMEPSRTGRHPFTIESKQPLPFGLAFWYDFGRWQVASVEGATDFRTIGRSLLFLRLDVPAGRTEVVVNLTPLP